MTKQNKKQQTDDGVLYVRCDGALISAVDAEAIREAARTGESVPRSAIVRRLLREALARRATEVHREGRAMS